MSSCQGELISETFRVTAADLNGDMLFDGTLTTLQNGFFELWLPRNRRINLSVQKENLKAAGVIETFPDSRTCITTFQLR